MDANPSPETHNKTLLSWEAPTFMPYPRGIVWYTAAGILMTVLFIYALLNSFTMALALLALGFAFWATHHQRPRMTQVHIKELGIDYDGLLYPYHDIKNFWLLYHPPYVSVLYFRLNEKSKRLIKIELNDEDPAKLRKLLLTELSEDEGANEPFFDLLGRLLRL